MKPVAQGLYRIPISIVNVYILEADHELAIVDAGTPNQAETILDGVRQLGWKPQDVKYLLVTHCHADHTGSLRALQEATGAQTYMHPTDAALVRRGEAIRPAGPPPGLLNALVFNAINGRAGIPQEVEPAPVDCEINEGDELPILGGVRVLHTPGHTAGSISFLWNPPGKEDAPVLIAGDTCGNLLRLGYAPIYEDFPTGLRTLARLSELSFQTAVFGHGPPIVGGAAAHFRRKWGRPA